VGIVVPNQTTAQRGPVTRQYKPAHQGHESQRSQTARRGRGSILHSATLFIRAEPNQHRQSKPIAFAQIHMGRNYTAAMPWISIGRNLVTRGELRVRMALTGAPSALSG
jgi:hypothetical protein